MPITCGTRVKITELGGTLDCSGVRVYTGLNCLAGIRGKFFGNVVCHHERTMHDRSLEFASPC